MKVYALVPPGHAEMIGLIMQQMETPMTCSCVTNKHINRLMEEAAKYMGYQNYEEALKALDNRPELRLWNSVLKLGATISPKEPTPEFSSAIEKAQDAKDRIEEEVFHKPMRQAMLVLRDQVAMPDPHPKCMLCQGTGKMKPGSAEIGGRYRITRDETCARVRDLPSVITDVPDAIVVHGEWFTPHPFDRYEPAWHKRVYSLYCLFGDYVACCVDLRPSAEGPQIVVGGER